MGRGLTCLVALCESLPLGVKKVDTNTVWELSREWRMKENTMMRPQCMRGGVAA